jgi:quinol monooxygenase YgiN
MSKDTVRFTVDLKIHEGKLAEFMGLAQAMIAASQKEPGTLGYDFYLSGDRTRCRLLEAYTDANAVLSHKAGPAVQEFVPKMLGVSSLAGFEVYGDPGPKGTQVLTGFGAEIFGLWKGLER